MVQHSELIPRKGNYKALLTYQKAEAIYDIIYYFEKGDRTVDQMIQAARAGKQNIAEGYYLRTRGHQQWEEDSVELKAIRRLGRGHNDSAHFMRMVKTRPPETIANMAIVLIKQTDYLLFRQLKALEKAFLEEGGMRERMTRMRIENRNRQQGEYRERP